MGGDVGEAAVEEQQLPEALQGPVVGCDPRDLLDGVREELVGHHAPAERPEADFWSVSQNDTYAPCECAACRALDEAEGGHSGSILAFVNRVAAEFPDQTLSTLAYQYSRSAPRALRPLPNVSIMLCSIECDRSRPIAEITAEVAGLVAGGVREVQLVSQNTSDFGRGTGEDREEVRRALAASEDLKRIRLLYLYAGLFPAERALRILELPHVVPYLDLPVQHASRRLLRAMRRPGDPDKAAAFFRTLRRERPDVVLRSTALLGFPGEEEEDVEELLDFLAEVEFDHLGTYRYSPEAETPAASLPDRPDDEVVADREARVLERLGCRLLDHVRIVPLPRERLLELGHPDADYEHLA